MPVRLTRAQKQRNGAATCWLHGRRRRLQDVCQFALAGVRDNVGARLRVTGGCGGIVGVVGGGRKV
jgi:hypothetical protein